jgi:hypothetical protein
MSRKISGNLSAMLLIVFVTAPLCTFFPSQKQQMPGIPNTTSSIYYGTYTGGASTNLLGVKTFEQDAGKNVSLIQTFEAWGTSSKNFDASFASAVRANGSIPFVTWVSTSTNATAWQPAYSLQSIIAGHFDNYITRYAEQVKSWGHPLFLRFDQEMNDSWAPWGIAVNGNNPEQFVAMWQHVYTIFMRVGVKNASWVWCPDTMDATLQVLQDLYPGDAYVNWSCMDGYNQGGKDWRTFGQIFGQTYQYLQQITNKPIIIAETASLEAGGDKAQYITDMLSTQLPRDFLNIKGFLWWNRDESPMANWRIESSSSSEQAFARAIASPLYSSNSYGSISSSPIPPP